MQFKQRHTSAGKAAALFAAVALLAPSASAFQEDARARTFAEAAADVQARLEQSLAELARVQSEIADGKVGLTRELNALESDAVRAQEEYLTVKRELDRRQFDVGRRKNDIDTRRAQTNTVSGTLQEYVRILDTRLHIAEKRRYADTMAASIASVDDVNIELAESMRRQSAVLSMSLGRIEEVLGGTRFEGNVVDSEGRVAKGSYLLVGPAAVFVSADGKQVGYADQASGTKEPTLYTFEDPLLQAAIEDFANDGDGVLPFDPTLGDARRIAATEDSLLEEVEKGGPVMIPIVLLAATAFLVALYRWIGFMFLRVPRKARIEGLLAAIEKRDEKEARAKVSAIRGPVGEMLRAGVDNVRESRDVIEEAMYETVLTWRIKLQRMLPFIAISAASAPLLGLLGTVTGIISTFRKITVFGSTDVNQLSGGISEALITTKFGLVVAIPALLVHAFLSRRARAIVGSMEQAAVAFVNQISKTPFRRSRRAVAGEVDAAGAGADPELVREQVREILGDLLGPELIEAGAVRSTSTNSSAS
ncbi:MAG: MotA/TolQ/ExbB proton channel family protein [Planctomycetota bacterium]